jgi:hypothetical protein
MLLLTEFTVTTVSDSVFTYYVFRSICLCTLIKFSAVDLGQLGE